MAPRNIIFALVGLFLVLRIYLRVRKTLGRQRLVPGPLAFRVILFAAVVFFVAAVIPPVLDLYLGLIGGLAIGVVLAWIGMRLTTFETTDTGVYYTPSAHIGLAVTLLFALRIGYRIFVVYSADPRARLGSNQLYSPLTLALLGITAGYYVAFGAGVLIRNRSLSRKT